MSAWGRRITPAAPCSGDDLDALVVGGGADVDPAGYEEAATAFGEVLTWSRIKVSSDRCGPFTVFLQASLGKF